MAIDPGTTESAWVVLDGTVPVSFGKAPNHSVLNLLRWPHPDAAYDELVIEQVESYGMPVGREVFDTVFWAGRFAQASRAGHHLLPRRAVKLALCGSPRANDATVRAALLDRYGGRHAKGSKHAPGPLHGMAGDVWQALGLGLAFLDTEDDRRAAR
jgi:hypothetical protein